MAYFGSRTRTGKRRIENRSGESMTLLSPSSPVSIGAPDVISNVGVAHDESPEVLRMTGREGSQEPRGVGPLGQHQSHHQACGYPADGGSPSRQTSCPYGLLEIWMMWATPVLDAVSAGQPKIEGSAGGTQHSGQDGQGRVHFGVAARLGELHRLSGHRTEPAGAQSDVFGAADPHTTQERDVLLRRVRACDADRVCDREAVARIALEFDVVARADERFQPGARRFSIASYAS